MDDSGGGVGVWLRLCAVDGGFVGAVWFRQFGAAPLLVRRLLSGVSIGLDGSRD